MKVVLMNLHFTVAGTAEFYNSIDPLRTPQNEEYGPVAIQNPRTGCEPRQLDNFDYSETYTAIFQNKSVDTDTEPSYSFDAELDDERSIHHCSLRSEKNQRT